MSCNGNCGCSCKQEIAQLKYELSQTLCRRDVGSYGVDADRVEDCIQSGNCVCRLKGLFTSDDFSDPDFLQIVDL